MSNAPEAPLTPAEWLEAHPDSAARERTAVAFLRSMEERDLAAAKTKLSPTFAMVFPGSARYQRLEELVAGSRTRYRQVAKRLDAVESFAVDAAEVVWVRGTLYGVNSNGVPFDGIRFVDRFELQGGLLVQQDVWNDLAESGVLQKTQ